MTTDRELLELWELAEKAKRRLNENDSAVLREQIVDTAASRGGFDIWFAVLGYDQDMRQRLVAAFCASGEPDLPAKRPG